VMSTNGDNATQAAPERDSERLEIWREIRSLLQRLAAPLLTCVDFKTWTPGSYVNPIVNPVATGGAKFAVYDPGFSVTGCSVSATSLLSGGARITDFGGPPTLTGLDCGFGLEITLPNPVAWVQLRLAHYAQPAMIEACENGVPAPGSPKVMSTLQGVGQTFVFSGTAIDKVFITPPQNETVLVRICF
jgi:hypothetical protein